MSRCRFLSNFPGEYRGVSIDPWDQSPSRHVTCRREAVAGEADCPFYSMQLGSCCWYSELMPELAIFCSMIYIKVYKYIELENFISCTLAHTTSLHHWCIYIYIIYTLYYRCSITTMECDDVTVSSSASEVMSPAITSWRFMKCLDHFIPKRVKHKRITVMCLQFLSTCDLVCGGRVRVNWLMFARRFKSTPIKNKH